MKNYTYLLIENGDFLMRKKHNKIRNTGLLYEFLLRQITADVLNKDDKSKAISIVKSRFNETTELGKELALYNIVVNKKFRERGLGSHLMSYLIKKCKELNIKKLLLEVSQNNLNAENFYNRFDFYTVGTRKNYYKDGSNALLKEKKLTTK